MNFSLHKIQGQVCPHCKATGNQTILFALAESMRARQPDGQFYWHKTTPLRALISCDTCRHPSMVTMTPVQQASGLSIGTDASAHEQYLNLLKPVEVLINGGNQRHTTMAINQKPSLNIPILHLYKISDWLPNSAVQRPGRDLLPDEVNAAFDELECIRSSPRHTIIGCRRILEIATGNKLDNPKPTLGERIGQLQGAGLLTKEIAEWARALKDILNGKAHEGHAPQEELANEVLDFTLLLVDLLYVYPAKIKKMQHSRAPEEGGGPEVAS